MPREESPPPTVYCLNVALLDVEPMIWRQFEVYGDVTLNRLHRVLQRVLGWTESHLHLFEIGGKKYGPPDEEFDMLIIDDRRVVLSRVFQKVDASFIYEYDYGDSWRHEISVERIGPPVRHGTYPRCLSGARACPPEDVGGTDGYAEFLEAIRDPKHAEHDHYLTWTGGVFDPEGFDVNAVNRQLWRMR